MANIGFLHQRSERTRSSEPLLGRGLLFGAALLLLAFPAGASSLSEPGPRSTLLVRWSYRVDPGIDPGIQFVLKALDSSDTSTVRSWTVSGSESIRKRDGNREIVVVDQATALPQDLTYRLDLVLANGEVLPLGTCRGHSHLWGGRGSVNPASAGALDLSAARFCPVDLDAARQLRIEEAGQRITLETGSDDGEDAVVGKVRELKHSVAPRRLPSLPAEWSIVRTVSKRAWAEWTIAVPTPPPEAA